MPTYDYECDACDHKFELFQSIMAEVEKKCPKCKKMKLRRLIGTGAAVVFKGSGFYQTDYRSESYKKSAASDKSGSESKSDSSSGSKSSEGKSESKSESSSSESKPADTSASKAAEPKAAPSKESKPKGKRKE
ncbi:MAG: zinc ribbon domain-containing protein [Planctomycetota bacterium]|nr:zinc ribbon domain-containing protein [Planctomycetota bacterium]